MRLVLLRKTKTPYLPVLDCLKQKKERHAGESKQVPAVVSLVRQPTSTRLTVQSKKKFYFTDTKKRESSCHRDSCWK